MATRANAATVKGDTSSKSSVSMLRAEAPQIRTADAIIEKHEQIQDALERSAISGKIAEQMGQTLKGIMAVEKLGIQYLALLMKMGRKASVPRTPILRSLIGLPTKISVSDGEVVRGLIGEK